MKKVKQIIYILIGIGILIQFIPVERPAVEKGGYDFVRANQVSADVGKLLNNACFDCHSNQTVYPWYASVAPVSWLVVRDIREGRKHLNFSEWKMLGKKEKLKVLDKISEEVDEGEMPMKIYPPLHPEARLSDADRNKIVDWSDQMAEWVFEN